MGKRGGIGRGCRRASVKKKKKKKERKSRDERSAARRSVARHGATITPFCRMTDSFHIAGGCCGYVGGHEDEATDTFPLSFALRI